GGGWLDAGQTRRLLEAYGLPLVPERLAGTPEAAVEAAHELGYPVVLKTATPGAHKTEEGGVILDLEDDDAVRAAAATLGGTALVDLLLRLSLLADELPELVELDLNPVLALPAGCLAVDARVRVADRSRPRRTKSW